jgi:GNAT superfamily N-acetyltransferase
MLRVFRTNSAHEDFIMLVKLLDADLAIRDGKDHDFYAQFNKITNIRHAIIVYENDTPVGCGAMKEFENNAMEIKRMFVLPESRNKGIATLMLRELEIWAAELSYSRCVLETGRKQPEAISLYTKNGYKLIPNYGQYAGIENSMCFEKQV